MNMNCNKYSFNTIEKVEVRKHLLSWFNESKRVLPWRKELSEYFDKNHFAYAVWVSEIMLQQTRVATVIEYYNRWMSKWPTVSCLSQASLDEVNAMWSGLGYYSRGRRLFEGACMVVNELDGKIPSDSVLLLKKLPGVGRYTAAAIASIAFNEAVGVLDGNVIRVLCRMRAIGGNPTSKSVNQHLWSLTDALVDPENPGDFNQALMELGSTLCTPKNPVCSSCPVKSYCKAYSKAKSVTDKDKHKLFSGKDSKLVNKASKNTSCTEEIIDVEDCGDVLALPFYDQSLGVENYPIKVTKKTPRNEVVIVVVINCHVDVKNEQKTFKVLMSKRPESGLLAGLWEFPNESLNQELKQPAKKRKHSATTNSLDTDSNKKVAEKIAHKILKEANLLSFNIEHCHFAGEYLHKFSHIHQKNLIYEVVINAVHQSPCKLNCEKLQWVCLSEFQDFPKPTLVANIYNVKH